MSHVTVWFQPGRGKVGRRIHGLLLGSALVLTASAGWARSQEVRPSAVAADARTASLARYVPRPDLLFYLEFDGLDAHAAAWRGSAAYKLLNDTKLGALLEDLALQSIELLQESVPPERRIKGAEVIDMVKQISRNGFVLAISGKPPDDAKPIVVLRHGDRPEIKHLLEAASRPDGAAEKANAVAGQKAGRALHRLGPNINWWVENGALVLTEKRKAEEIWAVLDGKQPSAFDHPLRIELVKEEGGFEAAAVGFLDMAACAPLPPSAIQFGLDGLKHVALRWGFQDGALSSVIRVVAPAPRRGLLALIDQPTFGITSLPPLPANTTAFAVMSIDLAKSYDQMDNLIKQANPQSAVGLTNWPILARQGLDLRKDLLAHIGPRFAFYAQAPDREETETAAGMLASRLAGFSFSAPVRNEANVARAIDPLFRAFNPLLRQQLRVAARNRMGQFVASLNFRKLEGPGVTYVMDLPPNVLSPPFSTMLRPTVTLSRDQLVVAGSSAAAERALAGGPRWQPTGAFIPVVNRLPAEMVYLSLGDPRVATPILSMMLPAVVRQINAEIALEQRRAGRVAKDVSLRLEPEMIPASEELNRLLFPSSTTVVVDGQGATLTHREAIPTITSPAMSGAVVALLMPAMQASREAARRRQCINNLKQIALAMHNYLSANNAFPRAAIIDEKGKPLLSWRVAILPYIEQQELYNKFKLDEPWDSPHNKALFKEMPATYLCQNRTKVEPFTTTYQAFVGRGAIFERDKDIGLESVTDGTSNTIMIVEAKEAVPWTKPADLSFDPAAALSLFGAGSSHPGGFNASMADGAVRFIKDTINLNVFRALITRNGGEVIGAGEF